MVQLSQQIHDNKGGLIAVKNYITKPEGFDIPYILKKYMVFLLNVSKALGTDLKLVLNEFITDVENSQFVVGHNVEFDNNIVGVELLRKQMDNILSDFPCLDTMKLSVDYCQILGGRGGRFKYPSLPIFTRNFW